MKFMRLTSDRYRFIERARAEEIKEVADGRSLLAMVADIALPGDRMAHLPIFGRYRIFTLSWAELAARIGADVICAFPVAEDGRERIRLEVINHDPDPFELAFQVFTSFRSANPNFSEWDLRKHHRIYPRIGTDDLTWDEMEAVACTDSRLLALVRQARAASYPLHDLEAA
jgi:hypothetical protein